MENKEKNKLSQKKSLCGIAQTDNFDFIEEDAPFDSPKDAYSIPINAHSFARRMGLSLKQVKKLERDYDLYLKW